jgi:flavoprotein
MVRIDHQFFTIVNSERVAFSVYTGKVKGIRTYLIRDDAGEFMNLIYEYDKNIDAKRSQNNVTEFFTKASAEVIRYLEIQKRTKKLKDVNSIPPVHRANDGQGFAILSDQDVLQTDFMLVKMPM